MIKYNENQIMEMYKLNLKEAERVLSSLDIVTDKPVIRGLNGWIFEQLVKYCIKEELQSINFLEITIKTQQKLEGRKTVDLLINEKIAIEVKLRGLFGREDINKYRNYIDYAKKIKHWDYLYITGQENNPDYKKVTRDVFKNNCFFLKDGKNQWKGFIERIIEILKYSN